jgi:hypothetical protein
VRGAAFLGRGTNSCYTRRVMTDLLLIAVIVGVGLVLAYHAAVFLLNFPTFLIERQYIRFLRPAGREAAENVVDYIEERRELALGMGFEYVDTYRAVAGRVRDLTIDLWLSRDRATVALVGFCRIFKIPYARTSFHTTFADGTHLTTQDNFDEGDPLRIRGAEVYYEEEFGPLFRLHEARVRAHDGLPVRPTPEGALGSLEDFEAQRVEQLVQRGWARYRDREHNAWSYTFPGAAEIYFNERPRLIKDHKEKLRRKQEESASFE